MLPVESVSRAARHVELRAGQVNADGRHVLAANVEAREMREMREFALRRTPLGPERHMRGEQLGARVVQRVDEEEELDAPLRRVGRAYVEEELERQREEHGAGGKAPHETYPTLALCSRSPERRLPIIHINYINILIIHNLSYTTL